MWDVTINTVYINKSKNQISTHTSRVGCDRVIARHLRNMFLFLLTHPVWDVTLIRAVVFPAKLDFYSHIPCGM